MLIFIKVIKFLWWIFVAVIPLWILSKAELLSFYSCPLVGDCYDFAALVKQDLNMFFIVSSVLLWPVCIWNLGGRSLFLKLKRIGEG